MTVADVSEAVAKDVTSGEGVGGRRARGREGTTGHVVPFVWPLEAPATAGQRFLKLRFDALTLDQATARLVERASSGKPFVYVVTPNVDHRVRLEREPYLHALYETAWMSLCDSRILSLMARMDGIGLPPAPGADLVERLFENEISPDEPVNIIGNDASVVAALTERYGLRRVRHHGPPMGLRRDAEAIAAASQFVVDNPARFTFICVGSPQQELVAQRILRRGDAKGVGLCCGAGIEFLTGRVPRAPRWMRSIALEWFHRLATDPRRMYHRYLVAGPRIFPIWLESRIGQADDASDGGTPAPATVVGASVHPAA
ncbi:MAG: WecB/TagA/CpsF family glycosyltransferase [Alphaproteobacteria bacterium]